MTISIEGQYYTLGLRGTRLARDHRLLVQDSCISTFMTYCLLPGHTATIRSERKRLSIVFFGLSLSGLHTIKYFKAVHGDISSKEAFLKSI